MSYAREGCMNAATGEPCTCMVYGWQGNECRHAYPSDAPEIDDPRNWNRPLPDDWLQQARQKREALAKLPNFGAKTEPAPSLSNDGIIELNPAPLGEKTVIVVTGIGRSGTSMVARMLIAAGIHMGDSIDDVVFEDLEMSGYVDRLNSAELRFAVEFRSAIRPLWGFKKPGLHGHSYFPMADIPNARLVVMVRDPVAIAVRAGMADMEQAGDIFSHYAVEVSKLAMFATTQTCPVLMVSYEKALANPLRFAQSLLRFCGLGHLAPWMPEYMAAMVEPERPHYVENARRR